VKRSFTFAFPSELVQEPVIYNLGMQFGIVTIIRSADINNDNSWMILDLEGAEEDIERGIAWVTGKGVKVEPADDLTEG